MNTRKRKSRKSRKRKNKSKKRGGEVSDITICTICGFNNVKIVNGSSNIKGSVEVCSNNHIFHFRCLCNRTNCPTCGDSIKISETRRIHLWCLPTKQEEFNDLAKQKWTD